MYYGLTDIQIYRGIKRKRIKVKNRRNIYKQKYRRITKLLVNKNTNKKDKIEIKKELKKLYK